MKTKALFQAVTKIKEALSTCAFVVNVFALKLPRGNGSVCAHGIYRK